MSTCMQNCMWSVHCFNYMMCSSNVGVMIPKVIFFREGWDRVLLCDNDKFWTFKRYLYHMLTQPRLIARNYLVWISYSWELSYDSTDLCNWGTFALKIFPTIPIHPSWLCHFCHVKFHYNPFISSGYLLNFHMAAWKTGWRHGKGLRGRLVSDFYL